MNNNIASEKIIVDTAERVKKIRYEKGLTLDNLAKNTGFAKSYLSQIENLKREPPISTLIRLAYALNVNVLYLITGENPKEQEQGLVLVKPKERKVVAHPESGLNYTYESVTYNKKNRLMDAYVVTNGPEFPPNPHAHKGQELVYVIEGKLELVYDDKRYFFTKGDCYYFESNRLHYSRSIGKKPSKVFAVFNTDKEK